MDPIAIEACRLDTPAHAGQLARGIEENSAAVLFGEPGELADGESTHPSPSRRLLFLWRERASYPLTAG